MELVSAIFNVGVGLGILLIGAALLVLVVSSIPLLRESRLLARETRQLVGVADAELRPTLVHARDLVANAEVLTEDVAVKLDRLTDLMNHLGVTLEEIRGAVASGRVSLGPVESSPAPEERYYP
jgi:uncharacterized protein YoxC